MSRAKIIKELKKKYPELNHQEIKLVVDCFSKTIGEALIKGKRVELRDFGTFFVKKIKAKFKSSKKLKEIINKWKNLKYL